MKNYFKSEMTPKRCFEKEEQGNTNKILQIFFHVFFAENQYFLSCFN